MSKKRRSCSILFRYCDCAVIYDVEEKFSPIIGDKKASNQSLEPSPEPATSGAKLYHGSPVLFPYQPYIPGIQRENDRVLQIHAEEAGSGYNTSEWIERVIQFPQKTEIQSDGRIRKWGWIKEEDKSLRVIWLEDGETVHNAFFDRSFKENPQ